MAGDTSNLDYNVFDPAALLMAMPKPRSVVRINTVSRASTEEVRRLRNSDPA